MENKDCKLEDLILNESFRDYVLKKNKEAIKIWETWIADHPEKRDEINKAETLLKVLLQTRKPYVPVDKNKALRILMDNLNSTKQLNTGRKMNFYGSRWFRVTAIMLIALLLTVVLFHLRTSLNETAFNEIIVPVGEKAQVVLSDGTHVWINSGSKFKYPIKYGYKEREVFLDGEAYFDVTKQHGKPFIVSTKVVKVKVLGTAFNLKSYALDKTVETTVVRGLVKVESLASGENSVLVNPNEKAIYVKGNNKMEILASSSKLAEKKIVENAIQPIIVSKINPEVVTCWKDQLLIFTDETLADMLVKMERWYNVNIQINDSTLRNERYNGKFVHNETIYQVLEAIKLTTPISYRVTDNNIIITRKQQKT